jgi:ribosome-associated protein
LFLTEGKTLRTATDKKVSTTLSTAAMDDATRVAQAFELALATLDDSKAEDIIPVDMRGKSALGDYMIIASGRSHRHVAAAADHLLRALREAGCRDIKVEGLEGGDWVLIDTGDIIVHIFRPEIREFYNLEKIWVDADKQDLRKTETVH